MTDYNEPTIELLFKFSEICVITKDTGLIDIERVSGKVYRSIVEYRVCANYKNQATSCLHKVSTIRTKSILFTYHIYILTNV
jgi:hypothetical protein